MKYSASLVVLLAVSASAAKLKEADVPKPVLAAFASRYPKAVVKAYSKEKKKRDGKVCYEVESKDGGVNRDVIIAADGAVLEVEEGIAVTSLPEAVAAALKAKYPDGVLKGAEKLTRGDETLYEVVVKRGGKSTEVVLDSQGKEPAPKKG